LPGRSAVMLASWMGEPLPVEDREEPHFVTQGTKSPTAASAPTPSARRSSHQWREPIEQDFNYCPSRDRPPLLKPLTPRRAPVSRCRDSGGAGAGRRSRFGEGS